MRNDIDAIVYDCAKDDIKPNYSAIARRFNVDYRTVKAHYERAQRKLRGEDITINRAKRPSMLDPYKDKIDEMLQEGCFTVMAIYEAIKQDGFPGKYGIVKIYCQKKRNTLLK